MIDEAGASAVPAGGEACGTHATLIPAHHSRTSLLVRLRCWLSGLRQGQQQPANKGYWNFLVGKISEEELMAWIVRPAV